MTVSIIKKELGDLIMINNDKLTIVVSNLGARILKIYYPDCQGSYDNLVHGYEYLERYLENIHNLSGATVALDSDGSYLHSEENQEYHDHSLGLETVRFGYEISEDNQVRFAHDLPGRGKIFITCTLIDSELKIRYEAKRLHIFNHSYFNLGDHNLGDHSLMVNSLTGADSCFDLRRPVLIDDLIRAIKNREANICGLDHRYWLEKSSPQLILENHMSGRRMSLSTNAPEIHIYSGNWLPGGQAGIAFLVGGGADDSPVEVRYRFELSGNQ